jgi:hypothetical protein
MLNLKKITILSLSIQLAAREINLYTNSKPTNSFASPTAAFCNSFKLHIILYLSEALTGALHNIRDKR